MSGTPSSIACAACPSLSGTSCTPKNWLQNLQHGTAAYMADGIVVELEPPTFFFLLWFVPGDGDRLLLLLLRSLSDSPDPAPRLDVADDARWFA